jgi:2-hydroxycyclohexanecarboxyl-CoA dehydrogenase
METLNQSILNLEGKVAIVTGAGQGVGEAISQLLAAHGAKVVVNDFFPDRAKRVADEILARGGSAIPVQADVTDATSVAEMVRQASAHYGPIDILVNKCRKFRRESQ